jgi:CDP-4-dehydro-6-deoxyglucose reductase
MTYTVTIQPSGHSFQMEADQTVLEAALDHGFNLPYGCRNGACGTCKGKLLSGQVDYGKHQAGTLTEQERAAGRVLFCTAKPLSDLVIEAKEVGAAKDIPIRMLPCRVQQLARAAHDVMTMRLKLPASERLQFLAGQYLEFILKDGKRRSYSMANAPHADEFLELHVRHVPGGLFTDALFSTLKERDILRFQGPMGSFFLREEKDGQPEDRPALMIASGTGFAPIKSMLEHAFHNGIDRQFVLYWGARTRADLYRAELPWQWEKQHANFSFIPVLSEPAAEDAWPGRTGFVHQAVLDDFPDLSGWQVYACGAPAMVDAARAGFTQTRALPEDEFYSDSFVFSTG